MKTNSIYSAFALVLVCSVTWTFTNAADAQSPLTKCVRQLVQQGVSPDEAANACSQESTPKVTCAEVSQQIHGYVKSECNKITNSSQDRCAVASLKIHRYVKSDCLELDSGGLCAVASLKIHRYVKSNCKKITNSSQDRCAVASLEEHRYVKSDCLEL